MRFFYILFFLCILFSCKPKTVNYSVKGKLVNGCDNSPIKNVKVQAIQMNTNDGFNKSGYSDASGDFEVLISSTENVNYRFMNLSEEVPLETVDYGNIPLYSYSTVYYRVHINNPYTTADTLWIVNPDITSQYYKMNGPFHDTVIGLKTITAINTLVYNARTKQINNSNTSNPVKAWYKINNINYITSNSVSISPAVCNTVADTLTLIID